ncbi:hypothetical protein MH138_18285 [Bacillus safensis]|uniref:hypothetical protein n=1 Tax=Bacteria TaxID=2 RepID=UPI000AAFA603|nr:MULTISPECIES: hypothetical protein [Bacteria]MCY7569970.1 hypothetical protein [Bacillus safensis]MCY7585216.1 hypothetical protein [Bacillus safensis]MCY7589493.1 hypothetical protein [Bacillus safensis]HCL0577129.1 hypothetical protein [Salmonella enterica subsp. enterica serovar Typhi]
MTIKKMALSVLCITAVAISFSAIAPKVNESDFAVRNATKSIFHDEGVQLAVRNATGA